MSRYLGLYVSEASEHLARLGAGLLRLEGAAREGAELAPLVDELFRHAHSVKGMSAAMALDGIAAVAHRAEDLVAVFRRRAAAPDAPSVDVLLSTVDALGAMVQAAAGGATPAADAALLDRLSAAAERARAPASAPPALPPAPAAPEAAVPALAPAPSDERAADDTRTVRVRVELLDGFLDAVGQLILDTDRLRAVGRGLPEEHRAGLDEGVDRLHATVKDLQGKVLAVRMMPLSVVTDRLPRAARDLARRTGKQVEVEVRGAELELDRSILDELADPLLHVLRNAVDHGLEAPDQRVAAGKPPTGRVTVTARRERDRVLVEVADDGRGMDPARLRAAAVERGALTSEAAAALGEREALLLACLPGVSTAAELTDVSGRGVGMDAVRRAVEALGGGLDVASAPGAGTCWTLRLPLTVAVQPVLLVRVGAEVVAVPLAKVHHAAQLDADPPGAPGGPAVLHDGRSLPVRPLADLLGFAAGAGAPRSAVVVEADGAAVALGVDALLGHHEAVLKPLVRPFDRVAGLSAVTVLGDGRPVFVLDVQRLLA